MELKIFISFIVICGLQVLGFAAGNDLYLDSNFCYNDGDFGVFCSDVDSRNYTGIVYQFVETTRMTFTECPYMTYIPKNMPSLEYLGITNTQLQKIKSLDILINSIKMLDLSSNNISVVSGGAFNSLTNLVWLNLGGNKLQSLPEDLFARAPLRHLNLSFNYFTSIDPELIQLNSLLDTLDVSYNKLADTKFLEKLPHVERLHLSGNCIGHIRSWMFAKLEFLRELFLADSCIKNIEFGSFPYNTLQILDLSHNNLSGIDRRIFLTAPKLEELYLKDTQIGLPAINYLIRTINLTAIEIPDNYYLCGDLVEVLEEIKKRGIRFKVSELSFKTPNINGFRCVQPT